jgi:hypothetical protein
MITSCVQLTTSRFKDRADDCIEDLRPFALDGFQKTPRSHVYRAYLSTGRVDKNTQLALTLEPYTQSSVLSSAQDRRAYE